VSNPNCAKCYHEESIGKTSLRQNFNSQFSNPSTGLKYLEIGFDNMCNLACDGCGPEFSSTWAMLTDPHEEKNKILSTVEINVIPSSLEKVLFLGGEPLMNNRHRRFLSKIPDLSKVEVIYNTNGSFLLDQKTIVLLQNCKSVYFKLSIDGYKDLNSTVRQNSQWQDILYFMSQLRDLGFAFEIHTVIHRNNWFGLPDLQRFVDQENVAWSVNLLTYPPHLDICNLSDSDKQLMQGQLEKLAIPHDFIIRHLNSKAKKLN
jgi:MoaA/NifB/PqqE/SkfB family radical SAM enzyme